MNRSQQRRAHVHHPVVALHVRELMADDDANAIGWPPGRGGRQNNLWSTNAPREEQRRMIALQEHDLSSDSVVPRDIGGDAAP